MTKAYNNKSFKIFLQESADDESTTPRYTPISLEDAVTHLNTDFSDCSWMVTQDAPLYRGERDSIGSDYALADPSITKRTSQNTSNFYTLIFDNHPGRKDFPKRSRSFICSTSRNTASGYARNVFAIIPGNSSKIAFVNSQDMWDTKIEMFNQKNDITAFNSKFSGLKLNQFDWDDWKKFDAQLKKNDKKAVDIFYQYFYKADAGDHLNFLETIYEAYSAESTGHDAFTSSSLSSSKMRSKKILGSEAWVSGPCLVVGVDHWDTLVKEFSLTK